MPLQGSAPITSLAFGPGGKVVALGTASNGLSLYRTDTCQMDDTSEQVRQTLLAKLPTMPGALSGPPGPPEARVRGPPPPPPPRAVQV